MPWRCIHSLIKHHTMMKYWKSGGVALHIHNLNTRWKWGVVSPSLTPHFRESPVISCCLFIMFTATLHVWRPYPSSTTWGHVMPWWQGPHITCTSYTRSVFKCFTPWLIEALYVLGYQYDIAECDNKKLYLH